MKLEASRELRDNRTLSILVEYQTCFVVNFGNDMKGHNFENGNNVDAQCLCQAE